MAARYWVGGTGNWDAATTTHWSTSSGGSGGASVPGASDDVTFDASSGGGTVTVTATQSVNSITGGAFTGTLDTNGQTITTGSFNFSGTGVRTLNLGASSITCTGSSSFSVATATNLTFNAGTSTLTLTNGFGATFASNNRTFYNVVISNTSGDGVVVNGFTCTNLTLTGRSSKTDYIKLTNNVTVTGTFTANGNSITNRLLIQANTVGTAVTITAATVSCTNVDFQDITGAGAGSWNLASITGGSGDCGGNSGITFTTAASQTWSGTSGGNWSTNAWTSRVPLPQDNVAISSAFSASQTVTGDMPRMGKSVDWTGATGTPAWNITASSNALYGSLTLISGMTVSGSNGINLAGRGSYTVTSAGKSPGTTGGIQFTAPGGTYTLADNLTATGTITFNNGTFVDAGYAVTATTFAFGGSGTRTITKTGAWSVTSTAATTVWNMSGSNVTFNDSGSVTFSTTSTNARTFAGGGKTYGNLIYVVAGSTGKLTVTGSNTFAGIQFSDATNARTLEFTAGTTTTITSAAGWQVIGTSGKLMTVTSATAATHTISCSSGNLSSNYLSLSYSVGTGGASFYAGANSTDGGNNTGWSFTNAPAGTSSGRMLLLGVG